MTNKSLHTKVNNMLSDLLPDYLSRRKADVERLQLAHQEKDYQTIKKVCHTIRGSAITFGFPGLYFICSQMEEAANQQNEDELKDSLSLIADESNWKNLKLH